MTPTSQLSNRFAPRDFDEPPGDASADRVDGFSGATGEGAASLPAASDPAVPPTATADDFDADDAAGRRSPRPLLAASLDEAESMVDESADALLPLPIHDVLNGTAEVDAGHPVAATMMPADRTMTPAHSPTSHAAPSSTADATHGHGEGIVCPFCAHVRPSDAANIACPRCTMQDTASTRRSTGERIGPWFVLQRKNPTAPGLRFSVLLTLARRGHVTPRSIVRGPTTGQLWRYAAQVKGLSRVFGVCWHCSSGVSPDATTCPRCRSAQEIPDDPDVFLESYASLPVMRETPNGAAAMAQHQPAELPAPTQPALEPSTFGSRQITAATGNGNDARGRSLAATRGGTARNPAERRIVPPSPPAPRQNLPARRSASVPATAGEAGQAIMSASELAAVFQLDSAERPGVVRRVGRFTWRATRVAAIFAVVVGIGGVAVAYLRPDWAAQARAYAEPRAREIWSKTSAWVSAHTATAAKPDAGAPAANAAPKPADHSPTPPPTPIVLATTPGPQDAARPSPTTLPNRRSETIVLDNGSPSTRPANPFPRDGANALPTANPTPQLDGLGGMSSTFQPASRPTSIVIKPIQPPAPATNPPAMASQQQQPAVREVATNNPPPAPARREPTLDEAITQAGALRNDALDAEARRDWKAAVIIYEQIMRLPEAAWPSDVKPRLEIAKQNLNAK